MGNVRQIHAATPGASRRRQEWLGWIAELPINGELKRIIPQEIPPHLRGNVMDTVSRLRQSGMAQGITNGLYAAHSEPYRNRPFRNRLCAAIEHVPQWGTTQDELTSRKATWRVILELCFCNIGYELRLEREYTDEEHKREAYLVMETAARIILSIADNAPYARYGND